MLHGFPCLLVTLTLPGYTFAYSPLGKNSTRQSSSRSFNPIPLFLCPRLAPHASHHQSMNKSHSSVTTRRRLRNLPLIRTPHPATIHTAIHLFLSPWFSLSHTVLSYIPPPWVAHCAFPWLTLTKKIRAGVDGIGGSSPTLHWLRLSYDSASFGCFFLSFTLSLVRRNGVVLESGLPDWTGLDRAGLEREGRQ